MWYLIKDNDLKKLWIPAVYFSNGITFRQFPDTNKLSTLWFYLPNQRLRYSEVFVITISCSLQFQTFPFDSHQCKLKLRNWMGSIIRVLLNPPTIYTTTENDEEIGGDSVSLSNAKSNYYFNFESLESTNALENGIRYSQAQVLISPILSY